MSTHSRIAALLGFVALMGSAETALATVMVELPLEALVTEADVIVVAEVTRSESRIVVSPERGAEPHTFSELEVREGLWGASRGATVTVEELGGTVRNETYWVSGTPIYEPGAEVVAFLERRADGSLRTLALSQGSFEIRRGVGSIPDTVRRDLEGVAFAQWAEGHMRVTHRGPEPALELEVFLETVRALVAVPRVSMPPTVGSPGGTAQ